MLLTSARLILIMFGKSPSKQHCNVAHLINVLVYSLQFALLLLVTCNKFFLMVKKKLAPLQLSCFFANTVYTVHLLNWNVFIAISGLKISLVIYILLIYSCFMNHLLMFHRSVGLTFGLPGCENPL